MRVTKKLRAEAALLCSAIASAEHCGSWNSPPRWVWSIAWWTSENDPKVRELEINPDAALLADAAHDETVAAYGRGALERLRETWAEAEALLWCGFVPEGWKS